MAEKMSEIDFAHWMRDSGFLLRLLDDMPVLVAIHDCELNIVWANKKYQAATGNSLNTRNDRKCYRVWNLEEPCIDCPVLTALRTGKPATAEMTSENQVHWPESQGDWLVMAMPIFTELGHLIGVIENIIDISLRVNIEKRLRQAQSILTMSQKIVGIGGWKWDISTQRMYWTEETYRLHGLEPAMIPNGSIEHIASSVNCYRPADRLKILDAFNKCVCEGLEYDLEFPFTTNQGHRKWIRTSAKPERNPYGKITAVVGNIMDITERKSLELKMRRKARFQHCVADIFRKTIAAREIDQKISYILNKIGCLARSDRAYLFSYNNTHTTMSNTHEWVKPGVMPQMDRLQSLPVSDFPWWNDRLAQGKPLFIKDVDQLGAEAAAEKEVLKQLGIVSLLAYPIHSNGRMRGFIGFDRVSRFRSWTKSAWIILHIGSTLIGYIWGEEENYKIIQDSLHEKELLLKEIHHRVKNNLQIISGLIYLQSLDCPDLDLQSRLFSTQCRINSMALIHEKVYQSQDFSQINFSEYLRQLTDELVLIYCRDDSVEVQYDLSSVFVDIQQSIPLGLIVNEIITNAFKHAFPVNRRGWIRISCHKVGKRLELSIRDNGIGFPIEMQFENMQSLGINLIKRLVEQLAGHLEITNEGGACLWITVDLAD